MSIWKNRKSGTGSNIPLAAVAESERVKDDAGRLPEDAPSDAPGLTLQQLIDNPPSGGGESPAEDTLTPIQEIQTKSQILGDKGSGLSGNNDTLPVSDSHLKLLNMLAERAVRDANQLATTLGLAAKIRDEARTESERIKEAANSKAQSIIDEAQAEARQLREDANRQAHSTISQARAEVELQIAGEYSKIKNEAELVANAVLQDAKNDARKLIEKARRDARIEAETEAIAIRKLADTQAEELALRTSKEVKMQAERLVEKANKKAANEAAKKLQDASRKAEEIIDNARRKAEAEAQEKAIGIKRIAELEAERLIEEAQTQARETISRAHIEAETQVKQKTLLMLQQAKQKALAIEAEAVSNSMQTKLGSAINVSENMELSSTEIETQSLNTTEEQLEKTSGEIHVDFHHEMDYILGLENPADESEVVKLARKADLEPQTTPVLTEGISQTPEGFGVAQEELEAMELKQLAQKQAREIISKARSEAAKEAESEIIELMKEARKQAREIITKAQMEAIEIGEVKVDEVDNPAHDRTAKNNAEGKTGGADQPTLPQEYFDGKVEINLVPPINASLLLGVIRHLGKIPSIRIIQTSGSWKNGGTIALSLDEPLPLNDLLAELPNVNAITVSPEKAEEETKRDSSLSLFSEQGNIKRISVYAK